MLPRLKIQDYTELLEHVVTRKIRRKRKSMKLAFKIRPKKNQKVQIMTKTAAIFHYNRLKC